jgi:type IV secretion system protein TrbL
MPPDTTSPSLLFSMLTVLEQAMVPSAIAIRNIMLGVFGILLTCQLAYAGLQFIRGKSVGEQVFWMVLRASLVSWLLYEYPDMLEGGIRWAGQLGLSANQSAITVAQFLDPGEILKVGLRGGRSLYRLYATSTGLTHLGLSLSWFLFWLAYIAAFGSMALNLLRWEADVLLGAVWGLVTLPFLAYTQTTWIGQGAISFVVNAACKFGLAGLLISVLFTFERIITAPNNVSLEGAMILLIGVWFIAGLFFSVNRLASSLIQGLPSLAGGQLIGAALATAAGLTAVATGGVGVVTGAAGLTARGAMATARQLSGTLAARGQGESLGQALRHAGQYVQRSTHPATSTQLAHFGGRQLQTSLRRAMQVARYGGNDIPRGGVSL